MYVHVHRVNVMYMCTLERRILITTQVCTHPIPKSMDNQWDRLKPKHVSPRIAGRRDVQGAWCNRYRVESQIKHILLRRCAGVATRAFANHFLSRLHFVGLRSPNKNKYHSTADTSTYSTSGYFYDPYNSRDLNPTEPTNHGCGSRRE